MGQSGRSGSLKCISLTELAYGLSLFLSSFGRGTMFQPGMIASGASEVREAVEGKPPEAAVALNGGCCNDSSDKELPFHVPYSSNDSGIGVIDLASLVAFSHSVSGGTAETKLPTLLPSLRGRHLTGGLYVIITWHSTLERVL